MINSSEIKDNFVKLTGREWVLVSTGDREKFSMVTVSWGGVGVLRSRPVVFTFARPERYAREFVDARSELTIAFLGPKHREARSICGSKSGRETDKMAVTGLTSLLAEVGNSVFKEARLMLECRVVYKSKIEEAKLLGSTVLPRWHNEKDSNTRIVYIAEILNAWEK